MSSPCSQRIYKLRTKNRSLLEQLESNSALLERRLKKLKHTARTKKHSQRSWENLPPSPLKRKFEAWKARNYSGQVSSALKGKACDCCNCYEESSDIQKVDVEPRQKTEDSPIMSPAKRTKHNVCIVSNPRRKVPKSEQSHSNPCKASTSCNLTKCERKYYCGTSAAVDGMLLETSLDEGETSPYNSKHCRAEECPKSCCQRKVREKSGLHDKRHRRILEAAQALLNYSPESVFLRRLKERSKISDDMLDQGNIRKLSEHLETYKVNDSEAIKEKFSPLKVSPKKKTSPRNSSPTRSMHFERPRIEDESKKVCARSTRGVPCLKSKSPQHLARKKAGVISPAKEPATKKKPRKRVCYRKGCHCKVVPQNSDVSKKYTSCKKENLSDEDSLVQDLSSPEDSPRSSCDCCCRCGSQPKLSHVMGDTIAGLLDNEVDKKYLHDKCCKKGSRMFDKLNEFRQSHWFDCHAYPSSVAEDSDIMTEQLLGSKYLDRPSMNDRLFGRAPYSDHLIYGHCSACHLTERTPMTRREGLIPITLPSKLQDHKRRTPLRNCNEKSSATANILSAMKTPDTGCCCVRSRVISTSTIGEINKWGRAPADSLALRYQKGVSK